MVHTLRIALINIALIALMSLTGSIRAAFADRSLPHTIQQATAPHFLPLTKFHLRGIDGPYHTKGNLILGADDYPYLFHGVARDDLEYLCKGDGHYTARELGYMGLGDNTAKETYWGANVVRLPLSEGFWL